MSLRQPDKIITVPGDDEPYMYRWFIIKSRWLNIYLHKIMRSDRDRELHDHPWWNISVVLRGGYWEIIPGKDGDPSNELEFVRVWRSPGTVVYRPASCAHRIVLPRASSSWSLFITGPRVREWGFWCKGFWVDWRRFDHAGCSDDAAQ